MYHPYFLALSRTASMCIKILSSIAAVDPIFQTNVMQGPLRMMRGSVLPAFVPFLNWPTLF